MTWSYILNIDRGPYAYIGVYVCIQKICIRTYMYVYIQVYILDIRCIADITCITIINIITIITDTCIYGPGFGGPPRDGDGPYMYM